MIGDDVGFHRRHPCKPIAMIQHAWSKLRCWVWGHYYKPCVLERGSWVQYTCHGCGKETKWMNKTDHIWFKLIECPTWGERGEDSQGYRFIGPPEPTPPRQHPGKKRKGYRKTA